MIDIRYRTHEAYSLLTAEIPENLPWEQHELIEIIKKTRNLLYGFAAGLAVGGIDLEKLTCEEETQ